MLVFETRAITQMALDDCETTRRALDGDEIALARTHHDANGALPRLFARIRVWAATAWQVRRAKRSPGQSEPTVAAPASP